MSYRVVHGDCVEQMAQLEECSIDAIVTDPPYGLEFMGKEWDRLGPAGGAVILDPATERGGFQDGNGGNPYSRSRIEYGRDPRRQQEWHRLWAEQAFRVLKPGGHLLAFGGTRTYHRLACAIEDAGFEIRDSLMWIYGSGFPKSLDVSKAIDRAAGAEREVVGTKLGRPGMAKDGSNQRSGFAAAFGGEAVGPMSSDLTAPATPEAAEWEGWGTALKPAHEPIVVARKPLIGTVAANVLEHGTGALNVDATRVEGQWKPKGAESGLDSLMVHDAAAESRANVMFRDKPERQSHDAGRWPANVLLDEQAAAELDAQTGVTKDGYAGPKSGGWGRFLADGAANGSEGGFEGEGGASRFFYVAKTSRAERNAGNVENVHPTVKPINLMRWLVRLVTPPGGIVLDPFLGSGSTGCAAVLEDFEFIGIEREADYVAIAEARIKHWYAQPVQLGLEAA